MKTVIILLIGLILLTGCTSIEERAEKTCSFYNQSFVDYTYISNCYVIKCNQTVLNLCDSSSNSDLATGMVLGLAMGVATSS